MMKNGKNIILGVAAAVLVFFGFILRNIDLKPILLQYKLLPVPESYTELYFEDHLNLPKLFKLNEENKFAFTVHNLENKETVYNYTVQANATDSASLLDRGEFTLKNDEYKTISEKFTIRKPHQKVKLTVTLENLKQPIHFYTEIIY